MMFSIQEVAHVTGTTSRTLRHYDAIGLLSPTRIGANGYRYYDEAALRRLQRILLLRELGLGLPQIATVLDHQVSETDALTTNLELLEHERERISTLIDSVRFSIESLSHNTEKGITMAQAQKMFDGFDHTQYREEVEQRWGKDSYAKSDKWYRSLGKERQDAWKAQIAQLNADWRAAAEDATLTPDSKQAQEVAKRHVEWLRGFQQASRAIPDDSFDAYVRGLAAMYPQDERFAANYGGAQQAGFVRDALLHYMDSAQE